MELYGSEEAPEYDLSRITTTIHILYGTNDKVATTQVSFLIICYQIIFWNAILLFCANAISGYFIVGEKIELKYGCLIGISGIQSYRFYIWTEFEKNTQKTAERS